jgi:hypothetical protein
MLIPIHNTLGAQQHEAAGARAEYQRVARACVAGAWSKPMPVVAANGSPAYVEKPFVVAVRGGFALIGTPALIWQSSGAAADTAALSAGAKPPLFDLAGLLLHPNGTVSPIPKPPGVGQMISPRAVQANDSAAHVVWATSPDTSHSQDMQATALWYARFDGTRWSTPQRIFSAFNLSWRYNFAGMRSVRGDVYIAAPALEDMHTYARHAGVAYIRRVSGKWSVSWVESGSVPAYVTLSFVRDRDPIIAFLGTVFRPGTDAQTNTLSIARSPDGGATWHRPAVLRHLGDDTAYDLQLVGSDSLHLLWAFHTSTSFHYADSVQHAVSVDAGRSWRALPALTNPTGLESPHVVALSDHELHLVAREMPLGTLLHAAWVHGTWTPVARLPFEPAASVPILSAVSHTAYLAWGAARSNAIPGIAGAVAPALLLSSLVSDCGPAIPRVPRSR